MTVRAQGSVQFGIALGGGAARGLAHLGVLQVLCQAGLVPDVVAGTSFGALVGAAALARDWDLDPLVDDIVDYVHGEDFRRGQVHFLRRRSDIEQTGMLYSLRNLIKRGIYYGFTATRASFVPPAEFRASISAVVPEREIESLPGRFAAIAADVHSGEEVVLIRGSLRVAVQASCAIPGVMPPVDIGGGRTCIDGGWVDKVPVEPCRGLGAEFVLAVDVSDDLADTTDLTTGLNVILRGDAIKSHRLKTLQLTRADHVIDVPVAHVDWADFPRAAEIIGIGRVAAEKALPGLLDALRDASTWHRRLRRRSDRVLRRLGLVESRRPGILAVEAVAPAASPGAPPVAADGG